MVWTSHRLGQGPKNLLKAKQGRHNPKFTNGFRWILEESMNWTSGQTQPALAMTEGFDTDTLATGIAPTNMRDALPNIEIYQQPARKRKQGHFPDKVSVIWCYGLDEPWQQMKATNGWVSSTLQKIGHQPCVDRDGDMINFSFAASQSHFAMVS